MISPRQKRAKLSDEPSGSKHMKREFEHTEESSKRIKTEKHCAEEDIQSKKRKNFVTACERVSYEAYFDQCTRFQLVYLPACASGHGCIHQENKSKIDIKEMPPHAEELFKIEMKTNMWCEALEVCYLCINPKQYLSPNVLKDIVEIMLNAHEDIYSGYTIEYLLDQCQITFQQNFSMHPPCVIKSLRTCYNKFLMSPLDPKENTFTNRTQFNCSEGVVKYCFNRLEHEISIESVDTPLFNKYEHIPEEMKNSVKGLHWQKEKFEIYELLNRCDRIERLMYVLESIIELLQFDLAIWHTRYIRNLGHQILRSHKPLMAYILWSNNVFYTGTVSKTCRQILKLFVQMVHLSYPKAHLRIMVNWLNTIIQTFYFCENNSNSDYPHTGKYCAAFAREFYKIISEMPSESIVRIIEMIQPNYMQHLVGTLHIKKILSTEDDDIIKIIINFVENSQWKLYEKSNIPIQLSKKMFVKHKKPKNFINHLVKICKNFTVSDTAETSSSNEILYPKFDPNIINCDSKPNMNHVIHTLYVILEAYLDAFSVQNVQETLNSLNEQLLNEHNAGNISPVPEHCSYTVTETFIKKYRSIYQLLKELVLTFHKIKSNGGLPEELQIFQKIGLLDL